MYHPHKTRNNSSSSSSIKLKQIIKAKIKLKSTLIIISIILIQSISIINSFESPSIPKQQLTCKPSGLIQDTTCDFETVDEVNRKLHSELSSAVQLPIFRYHKVDLYRQCPFWEEDGLCGNRACAVDELDQNDIPAFWRDSELSNLKTTDPKQVPIDLENKCLVKEQDYCVLDSDHGRPSNGVYVDLLANPERFTGYSGASAHRIWKAIYEENCFDMSAQSRSNSRQTSTDSTQTIIGTPQSENKQDDVWEDEKWLEKRVYYKLLSGLHTSISMHICDEYLDPSTGQWVPNLQCYLNRIGLYPERLENLYFAYTLMLRALSRSASYLGSHHAELSTGDPEADSMTRKSLDRLIAIAHAYPVTFDETRMFKSNSEGKSTLKEEFKAHFRNVSRIMDCVGCDKCRLWGKLQIMGLGTGLKLLFEHEEGSHDHSQFYLTRPELIAFINTLNRLSESLAAVEKFTKLWEQRSAEGTLPTQVNDEKLDGLASGRAAQAISLTPGFGPRLESSRAELPLKLQTKKLTTKPSTGPQSQTLVSNSNPHRLLEPIKQVTSTPSTPQDSPAPSEAPVASVPRPAKLSYNQFPAQHSASNERNGSDPFTHRTTTSLNGYYHVVDLALIAKFKVSRLFRFFSHKCKHSYLACSHFVQSLFGHMKPLFPFSSRASNLHPSHFHDQDFQKNPSPTEKKEL